MLEFLLRGIEKTDIQRGHVLANAQEALSHTLKQKHKFMSLTKMKAEGIHRFFKGYRPQFFFGTADVTGNSRIYPRALKW